MYLTGISKLLVGSILVWHGLTLIMTQQPWWFMQNVNLLIHETGHLLFYVFGNLLYILGGTILELTIPIVFSAYFFLRRDFFSSVACNWWVITALTSVSVYINDADTLALPLITGDPSTHDWLQILTALNLYQHDETISQIFVFIAVVVLAAQILLLFYDRHIHGLWRTIWTQLQENTNR